VILMMTSFLLIKGLRIAMMYQGVNVDGLEAYGSTGLTAFMLRLRLAVDV